MKGWILIGGLLLATASALWADGACGDEQVTCGEGEKCCEHIVAMFSSEGATAPPYVQGQCIPKRSTAAITGAATAIARPAFLARLPSAALPTIPATNLSTVAPTLNSVVPAIQSNSQSATTLRPLAPSREAKTLRLFHLIRSFGSATMLTDATPPKAIVLGAHGRAIFRSV